MKINSTSGLPDSGFLYDLQQMISYYGGFEFQYVLVPDFQTSSASDDKLLQVLPYVDLYGNWFPDTAVSRSNGIGFTQAAVDASLVLVTFMGTEGSNAPFLNRIFTFLLPFSNEIWIYIALLLVVNGFVHWYFERPPRPLLDPIADETTQKPQVHSAAGTTETNLEKGLATIHEDEIPENCTEDDSADAIVTETAKYTDSGKTRRATGTYTPLCSVEAVSEITYAIYLSIITIWQRNTMESTRFLSCWISIGFTFFNMIILATYMANLAQILLQLSQPQPRLLSIDEANAVGSKLCMLTDSPYTPYIRNSYPHLDVYPVPYNRIDSNSSVSLLAALQAGHCDGALLPASDFRYLQLQTSSNSKCDLVQAGPAVRNIKGSFPYLVDYSHFCTSIVESVISEILVTLQADGTLESLFSQHSSHAADQDCSGALGTLVWSELIFVCDC